jgi:RNA polymerase sigma factor (sigma-70 family)
MTAPKLDAGGGSSPAPVLTIKQHQLVRDALPLVHECADTFCWAYDLYGRYPRRHVHRGGPDDCIGYSDMCTIGKLALYDAVPRFQEARNRSFRRFAKLRVFGAMMDELKCTTRQARMDRAMLRAVAYFLADYNDDFDISKHDTPEIQRRADLMCDTAAAVMFVAGAEQTRVETACDTLADAEENVVAVEGLREIVRNLSEETSRFLDMLFGAGFDQHKVAEELGLARETVCRRLARLCADLRRLLKVMGIKRAPPPMQLGLRPVLNEPEDPPASSGDRTDTEGAKQKPRRRR